MTETKSLADELKQQLAEGPTSKKNSKVADVSDEEIQKISKKITKEEVKK